MKIFLKNITVFISIFLLVNFVYYLLIVFTDLNFKKRIESLNFRNPDYEVLVIGNSMASDAFDTELMTKNGLKSFNLSIPGSSLKTNLIQLQEYIDKYKTKPKYVILGIGSYMGTFDMDEIHPIVDFTMSNHQYSYKDLPLVKFQWLMLEMAKKIVSSAHRNATLINGQIRFQKARPDLTDYSDRKFDIGYYENSRYTAEIAQVCTENDIKLIVIEMPGFKDTRTDDKLGPYQLNFKNGFKAEFYYFNSKKFGEIFNPKSDWIGNSHLNEYGGEKFTIEVLTKVFHLEEYNTI